MRISKEQLGVYIYVCAGKRGLWRRVSNVFGCSRNLERELLGTGKRDNGQVFLDKVSLQTTVHTFVPTEGPVWINWDFSYLTFTYLLSYLWARWLSRYSDWATGWTVRDRTPVGTGFFARPDRPWGPPSLLYNGYRVFPGGKVRPRRAADHSPPSSAAVMEE